MENGPIWLWAFAEPVHGNPAVQVMIAAVLLLIVADLLFGMLAAVVQRNFQSGRVREGLAHKCSELAFLLVADVIDALLFAGVELPFDGCAMMTVGTALVLMEVASLMEVATRINPKLAGNPLFRVLDDAHIIHADGEGE